VLMLVVSILHLHYLAASQMDALRTTLESLMSSRRSFLQATFPLLATRTCVYLRHLVM
jgi:hypothetical protein